MTKLSALLSLAVALAALTTPFVSAPAFAAGSGFGAGPFTHPGKPKPSVPSTYKCGQDLGYLRRVYEEQIEGIDDASIVPICDDGDYGLMRSDGNAGAIRQHIADNSDIMDALDAANFGIDDVVGVRMTGDETAIIYVHTFHYR